MYCQQCGVKNPDKAFFCVGCGAKMYNPMSEQNQTQTVKSTFVQNNNEFVSGLTGNSFTPTSGINSYFSKHKPNIPGIVVSILLFITAFLTAYHEDEISRYTYSFSTKNYNIFIIIVALAALACSIFDISIGILVSGLLSGVIFTIVTINVFDRFSGRRMNRITFREGYWALIGCAVLLIACGIFGLIRAHIRKKRARMGMVV